MVLRNFIPGKGTKAKNIFQMSEPHVRITWEPFKILMPEPHPRSLKSEFQAVTSRHPSQSESHQVLRLGSVIQRH